jgi:WD40 repeat protein
MSVPAHEPSAQLDVESEATAAHDDLLAALADDFAVRLRRGEHPAVEEYVEKHPTLAEMIRKVLSTVVMIEHTRSLDFAPAIEGPGSTIGRYKLFERIGEGGFGVVYMAEQQQPVRRKVALKVIKPGIDTRQVIARFEAERQALALMDHENIAKVLDAGATDSGRPYFVMELVRGVPITDFCDKNELSPRERLELFVDVCRAVQHAHTKGIIHRDIKPTNVLVTLHEGVSVPKIIDFGVAKATGQQLTEKTLFTQFAQLVGTPLYMSPEQAEMTGIDVDTRSDVYSLGVLLYELLTGTTPLDSERLKRAAFDEVRRIIREEEPPRPSARLSTMGDQAQRSISAQRGSDPKQLGRLVRGELDWIVMKAMEKERARRYETASALAADVERYLRDEPVEACPPSAWYRFRKFARRRTAALAAISGVVLMIFMAAGMLAVSNVRVSEALRNEIEAKADLETALDRERDTLERERRNSYGQRIALAEREWSANNLSRMEVLLNECPSDLLGWEWHYLRRLRYSTLRPLRHDSPVISVAFSPNGKYLATGTQAGIVRIWLLKTGEELRRWPAHELEANGVRFSSDGRYLATGSSDRTVKVWDVEKVLEGEVNEPFLQREHASRVCSIDFSPDGQMLVSGGGREAENTGEIRIWDMNQSQETLERSLTWGVRCVRFSSDGRRLATCGQDTVQIWDPVTGRELLTLADRVETARRPRFSQVAFSPDGRRLAAVGGANLVHPDREIKIFDAGTGEEIQSLRGHVGGLWTVAFSPDGRRLASAGLDQTIKLWDTANGQEILTLRGHLDNIRDIAFSPDGQQLASTSVDNTVRIWDAAPLEHEPTPEHHTLHGHKGAVTEVAFHPTDGRSLVSAGTDGTVRVWDALSGEFVGALPELHSRFESSVAYSLDGRRLATVTAGPGEPIRMWDAVTEKEICKFPGHISQIDCLAFSPDGAHVASGGWDFNDNSVRVWDAATAEEIRAFKGYNWAICDVAFSPDGRHLASCGGDGTVRICDWTTGDGLAVLEPRHTGRVESVAFSRDGKWLASASWDRTVKIWDTGTWTLEHDLRDRTGAVLSVAFANDRRLAWGSTDSTIKVWDGPDAETHVLRGHTSWVQAVAFSTNGKWIASASLDGTVKIWKAPAAMSARTSDPSATND